MASSPGFLKHPELAAGIVVVLVAAVACSRPFWPGELARHPWMTFVRDDFFYYLKIARHLAAGDGSTFNGIVRTNGYHPLWLLLLAAVASVSVAPKMVLGFVAATSLLSTIATYLLSQKLLARCGLAGWQGSLAAAYTALCALPLCYYGMEVTLAMPLALALAWHAARWSPERGTTWWALAGLLASVLTLARVDACLFAILVCATMLSNASVRQSLRPSRVVALFAGLLPMLGYLLWNRVSFGLWLPVSGTAKQLRSGWTPALNIWGSVMDGPRSAWLNLLLVAIALVVVIVRWRRTEPRIRELLLAMLAYPVIFTLLLSIRSDWEMWPWYAWVWRPATCAALAVLLGAGYRSLVDPKLAIAVLSLLVALRLVSSAWLPGQEDFHQAAVEVAAFAQTHPGIYAMGDRAGMISWLLPAPLIQVEGLVMDRAFLEHIRRQEPLIPVLRGYGVRYYIVDDWHGESLMHDGCFDATEPAFAGPESPHMRGRTCGSPLLKTTHQDVDTLIYDLSATSADLSAPAQNR